MRGDNGIRPKRKATGVVRADPAIEREGPLPVGRAIGLLAMTVVTACGRAFLLIRFELE
jgi:hypothetical protein